MHQQLLQITSQTVNRQQRSPWAADICATAYFHTVTRGVQKVLQLNMLDWKTSQNLYTNKTHVFLKHAWA